MPFFMDVAIMPPAILVAVALLWWLIGRRQTLSNPVVPVVVPGISIVSVPFLTETQASFYNLLRLAVSERYLVFAHVPLWAIVDVEAGGRLRTRVFSQIALKRLDFVLVHPGSRQVEQAILVEEGSPRPHEAERRAIIKSVLEVAGVPLRRVDAQKSYSVADLSALLGLAEEDSA
jgi:hypothetical protein